MKKKINIFLLLFTIIHFLFFYNSIFGTEIKFYMDFKTFYRSITVVVKLPDPTFSNKNQLLIINLFNIILPLIVLSFCKGINFNINQFKFISFRILNGFLYSILFYLSIMYMLTNASSNDIDRNFINIHSMIYVLNIHFVLILDSIYNLKNKEYKKNLFNLFLILFCFLLSGTTIHLLICFVSALTYFIYFGIKKKYLYLFILCVIFLGSISFTQFIFFNHITDSFNYLNSGSGLNAIYIRLMNISFFLFYPINYNPFIGNSIFVENIYTYPHNIFIDILINAGLSGLIIFLIVMSHFFKEIKKNLSKNNFFILIILFQSFLMANLSGFLFSNILFNSALALSMLIFQKNT